MVKLNAKSRPSHMEDLLITCLLLENSKTTFLMEITLEISCNAKDPPFSYLKNMRPKKLDMLQVL